MKSFNFREEVPKYDEISNEALDSVVSQELQDFYNCGIQRMKGFLLGQGVRVQWSTDPSGILL